jgi:hypothetical protein
MVIAIPVDHRGARPRTAHHLSDIRQHFMISSEYNKKFSEFSSLVNSKVSLHEAGKSSEQCAGGKPHFRPRRGCNRYR